MSAKSIIIWTIAATFGLAALSMLAPQDTPVASLKAGLGPQVTTEAL